VVVLRANQEIKTARKRLRIRKTSPRLALVCLILKRLALLCGEPQEREDDRGLKKDR
jgi:hypothetical protein